MKCKWKIKKIRICPKILKLERWGRIVSKQPTTETETVKIINHRIKKKST
jgi:hypothetical protein